MTSTEKNKSQPYRKEARQQLKKISTEWPEGELVEMLYNNTDGSSTTIIYSYEPKSAEPFNGVNISLYINCKDINTAFESMTQNVLRLQTKPASAKEEEVFDEWPHGFPDQNDYEQVSKCVATKDRSQALWAQNDTLVVLQTIPGSSVKLFEYADGMWQVVYGMGL